MRGLMLSPSARTGLADLAPRAKVGQTAGCSTFIRGAKPATRRVADGERVNPQGKERAYAPMQKTMSTRAMRAELSETAERARCVPDQPVRDGNSRSPPDIRIYRLMCRNQADPLRKPTCEQRVARRTRVAVWVAVRRRPAPFSEDRPRGLVQLEPIRTAATRAANAVGCNHPPGFKSPILRSSQNTQGQGLTHQATQGRDSGRRRAQHETGQGSQRFISAKTPQPRYSRRYRAYRAGLDASSARISSASSW